MMVLALGLQARKIRKQVSRLPRGFRNASRLRQGINISCLAIQDCGSLTRCCIPTRILSYQGVGSTFSSYSFDRSTKLAAGACERGLQGTRHLPAPSPHSQAAKILDQFEVLEHHADCQAGSPLGCRVISVLLPWDNIFALIGFVGSRKGMLR